LSVSSHSTRAHCVPELLVACLFTSTYFSSLPPSPPPEQMNQKKGVARPAKTSSSTTTRSDRGAALTSAAAGLPPANDDRRSNSSSHGIIFYLHRPIGAPMGTVRLSLEDDPAVMGRTSSFASVATKRISTRGSYWAVPHPWKDFQVVWQQHEHGDSSTRRSVEHVELSGNPAAWGRLTVDEWADCCKVMSGNASVSLRFSFSSSHAPPRWQPPLARKQRSHQRPVLRTLQKIMRVESVRFLDGCPTPEQRQQLLRQFDPHRLEICTVDGSGVRQALEPILARRNLPDDRDDSMRDLILHGPVLDVDDCRDVAKLMTAFPQSVLPTPGGGHSSGTDRNCGDGLRRLTLRSVTFASREAWELLLEAMKSSLSMEGVTWDQITYCDDGSEVQQGNEMTGRAPPLVRLDRDDDNVMKQLKDELAQLHAFNALHRAACTAVRSHHRLHRQSNQRDDETRECQHSLDVVDSAIEVLRQWYLSSTPAAVAVASTSCTPSHPGTMPAPPPQTRSVANDLALPVSAKTLTMSDVVRRSRLLSSCS
jgi:hypothetical protein